MAIIRKSKTSKIKYTKRTIMGKIRERDSLNTQIATLKRELRGLENSSIRYCRCCGVKH